MRVPSTSTRLLSPGTTASRATPIRGRIWRHSRLPGSIPRRRSSTWAREPASEIFGGWFAGAAADPADGYTSADYAEHIRTEFSTYRWLLEPMLAAAGFEIVAVTFERRLYGAYTCVKAG